MRIGIRLPIAVGSSSVEGSAVEAAAVESLPLAPCRESTKVKAVAKVAGLLHVNDADLGRAIGELGSLQQGETPWAEGWHRRLDGELEIDHFPSRRKIADQRTDPGHGTCSLCGLGANGDGIRWRDLRLAPNLAPYVPAGGTHLVVGSEVHRGQGIDLADLRTMIELSELAGRDQPVTLHYNGLAGNSQFHWHWQLTTERLPLEAILVEGRLPLERLRKSPGIEIDRYSHGLLKGVLLRGTSAAVTRWGGEIIRKLNADPRTAAHYNLFLLPRYGDQTRLAIVPRRALAEGEDHDHGAFTYAGRMVVPNAELSPEALAARRSLAEAEVIDPRHLEWLDELSKAPEPPFVALRADKPPIGHWLADDRWMLVDGHGEWALPSVLSAAGVRLPSIRVPSPELRLLLFGDSGNGSPEQAQVARQLGDTYRERKCHFAIHTGDLVYPHGIRGPDDPAIEEKVRRPYKDLERLYLTLGNHDRANREGIGDPDAWVSASDEHLVMPSRYYQFNYRFGGRSADFFVLDTMVLASDDAQRAWLKMSLEASRSDYKIVIGHHPPYSYGLHGSQAHMQTLLLPELSRGVDLYAGGHEHDLQVLENDDGILFLVSGAAAEAKRTGEGPETKLARQSLGFMALSLDKNGITVEVLDGDGKVLHREARPGRRQAQKRAIVPA